MVKIADGTPVEGFPFAYWRSNGTKIVYRHKPAPTVQLVGTDTTSAEFLASYETAKTAETAWRRWFGARLADLGDLLNIDHRLRPTKGRCATR
jgi:hypothetical protein